MLSRLLIFSINIDSYFIVLKFSLFGEKYTMKVNRRSKLERYFDVLKVISARGPIRQTHIMYKANLTWDELKKDLEKLMNLSIIEKIVTKEGIFYRITPEGIEALSHISKIESMLMLDQRKEYATNSIKFLQDYPI